MTRDEFGKMRFHSGMEGIYQGEKYPILSVDFEEDLIGLDYYDTDDSVRWVRCENVTLVIGDFPKTPIRESECEPLREEVFARNMFNVIDCNGGIREWTKNAPTYNITCDIGKVNWLTCKHGSRYFEGEIRYVHELRQALITCGIDFDVR